MEAYNKWLVKKISVKSITESGSAAPEERVIRSVTGRVTEKVTDKVTDTLDEISLKILNLLAVDPAYTTTFLAKQNALTAG